MNIEQMMEKIHSGESLTQEERHHMLTSLEGELRTLKEKDPKSYLSLLNLFIDAMRRASHALSAA